MSKEFPSLDKENDPPPPCGWVQWKGTDVCVDLHCSCGKSFHYDGDFMYYVKCPYCGQHYECGGHIILHPVPPEIAEGNPCLKLPEKDLLDQLDDG